MERNADSAEWIQRGRGDDLYGGSSGDVRDYAANRDTDIRGRSVYGDVG